MTPRRNPADETIDQEIASKLNFSPPVSRFIIKASNGNKMRVDNASRAAWRIRLPSTQQTGRFTLAHLEQWPADFGQFCPLND